MTDAERTALLRKLSATACIHTVASLSSCCGSLMGSPGRTRSLADRLCDEGLACRYEAVRGRPGAVHGDYFYEITRDGLKALEEAGDDRRELLGRVSSRRHRVDGLRRRAGRPRREVGARDALERLHRAGLEVRASMTRDHDMVRRGA